MNDQQTTLHDLKELVKKFVAERDWSQYHNAKNLSMNTAMEAAELMEIFVWADSNQIQETFDKNRTEIEHELADVVWSIICLCNRYDIDLAGAIERKVAITAQRYPVEKCRGKALKYTKLT